MQAALIDELLEIMPKGLTRFAFQNSGSESVENAVKIARAHTKRKAIIAFEASCLDPPHACITASLTISSYNCRGEDLHRPTQKWAQS